MCEFYCLLIIMDGGGFPDPFLQLVAMSFIKVGVIFGDDQSKTLSYWPNSIDKLRDPPDVSCVVSSSWLVR